MTRLHTLSIALFLGAILSSGCSDKAESPAALEAPGTETSAVVVDLGFIYYFGMGAGLDFYIPERLWGKIGRNFIGLRASGIVGDDVRGWSIVLSLRN